MAVMAASKKPGMFRSCSDAVGIGAVWVLTGAGILAFWVGFVWLVLSYPDVFVRGFIGIGMLLCCACFWKSTDSRAAKLVAAVLTVLVGYVAFSVLGVF